MSSSSNSAAIATLKRSIAAAKGRATKYEKAFIASVAAGDPYITSKRIRDRLECERETIARAAATLRALLSQ